MKVFLRHSYKIPLIITFFMSTNEKPQVNIVKKMSYIWVKNVVVFINQRAIFPVSEARFKLSLFFFIFIIFTEI